ncbi:homogentisate 1,2-dioxygenase [Ilumatobacter nonamiensis]|uniref:homogentisate 1,2-dioxygenase n=1 Tax=Ilumatobacter nonamiensis TaxID=467093 RepID=UPI000349F15A|nr:homogentisate 1,2-dioxygenase [Ilumatobacter nonamiensis]
MAHYRRMGNVPPKRHTHHHDESGHRYAEELMGQEGFSANSSLLYHRNSPSALADIEALDDPSGSSIATADRPLTPRHIRTGSVTSSALPDLVDGRRTLLTNDDVEVAWAVATNDSGLYRNAVGDELVFIHEGRGTLESVFGRLDVGSGDYVVVPAATTHRWVVTDGPIRALIIASRGHIAPPAKYLSRYGQLLEHAPYCERDLRGPTELIENDTEDVPVLVRNRGGWSRHIHRHHPFDVVGWDGCVYPHALNIADFEPIVGSIHQPPPVHQTFELPGAVICSFVPRLFDFHPDAVKVPYHHANTDSDEVLFYAAGNFMSRAGSGIDVGSISYHPAGFIHGPQPGSIEGSLDKTRTEETAVMLDTFAPLRITDAAREASDPDYPFTWAR